MADAGPVPTESPEQNIQEFAETAMKEMLSWYGYERRDSPPPERCERRDSPSPAERSAASLLAAPRLSRPVSPGTDGSVSPPRPVSPVTAALANDGGCKRTPVVCSWCNKLGAQLYTMGSKAFCSEPCFSQSRVANFRKTKLCDWCKNIRDSLNIEFINGDQQLQFCSESCLDAYKMNIFCKETEAHIQMLPQLRELVSRSSKDPLITPEMWLRDRAAAQGSATSAAGETLAPLAADEGGAPTPAERRRLRRARPDPHRPPLRGVRARSHTMPVLELRERTRRRPSAPSRQPPPPPLPPAASMASAATASHPAATAAAAAAAAAPPGPPPLWQRYHLLRPQAPAGSAAAPPPPPPLPTAFPPGLPLGLPPGMPPMIVLLPVPVAVPVPVPIPIPVPEDFCRELLARSQSSQSSQSRVPPSAPQQSAAPADCPILKRELEKESASGSDAEGLDLTVRKRKTDHPRKIKMEEDDFD